MKLDDYYYHHLLPRTLDNKEDILSASKDIENSFTGRLDVIGLHIFFSEASSLINNAVSQYEQGFFDAAFYSVRSALELARVVAYFSDQDQPIESDIYKKWAQGGKFPYDSQIRDLLSRTSAAYGEVREALPEFFITQDQRLKQVQKYIHKQGYRTFYHQNPFRPDLKEFREKTLNELFADFITNSTVEIALLRLCIDPFPLLLQDKTVMYKIHFQSVTEPYSDKTVKLIGEDNIAKYMSTKFYHSHIEFYSTNEELEEPTHNLINSQYYDRSNWNIIKKQLHLLSYDDTLAVMVFNACSDITRVYLQDGWHWYFSETDSLRKNWGFDSETLHKLKDARVKINAPFEEVFMSYISFGESECWLEHNKKVTKSQLVRIEKILQENSEKMKVVI